MPAENIVNFSDSQVAIIQGHLQNDQFAEAYNAAASAVKADPGYSQNEELQRLATWLDTAAKINGEPNSGDRERLQLAASRLSRTSASNPLRTFASRQGKRSVVALRRKGTACRLTAFALVPQSLQRKTECCRQHRQISGCGLYLKFRGWCEFAGHPLQAQADLGVQAMSKCPRTDGAQLPKRSNRIESLAAQRLQSRGHRVMSRPLPASLQQSVGSPPKNLAFPQLDHRSLPGLLRQSVVLPRGVYSS